MAGGPLRRLAGPLVAAFLISGIAQPTLAQDATAAFTDSAASGLAATKRVAITSVIIAFQASTGAEAGATLFIPHLTARDKVQSVLAMPEMNPVLQDVIAAAAYRELAAQLTAAGYEVVPEAQVTANANYQSILQQGGFANHSRFANAMGDVMLVGAPGLAPYTAYQGETGAFAFPSTTYLAWISAGGAASTTPGGLSVVKQANAWKVPGLEVALAKDLNAQVVKAYYVVSLGRAEAKRSTSFSVSQHTGFFTDSSGALYHGNWNTLDRTVTGKGEAFAQVGLVADQTHIAFRTPDGNAKWQKVSMLKVVPPKDGDVVVRLAEPVAGSTEFFSVHETDFAKAGGLLSTQKRGDINLMFNAQVADEAGYGKEVTGMIEAANRAMVGLVKRAN